MKPKRLLRLLPALSLLGLNSCTTSTDEHQARQSAPKSAANEMAQAPTWSREDLDFFLHGSMSTEFVPETGLRAFSRAYPDLFPSTDYSHLDVIPDPKFVWPIGFTRDRVAHLGGLSAVGLNCAACHVGEVAPPGGGAQTYSARCASCHDGPETGTRLHSIAEIQTDPNGATIFTPQVAELFNKLFAELQIPGYEPPQPPPLRGTQQYWSPSLSGVWARAVSAQRLGADDAGIALAARRTCENFPSRLAGL